MHAQVRVTVVIKPGEAGPRRVGSAVFHRRGVCFLSIAQIADGSGYVIDECASVRPIPGRRNRKKAAPGPRLFTLSIFVSMPAS